MPLPAVDNRICPPHYLRAEEALKVLRQRMERHVAQEVRLGQLYQGWQDCWSSQLEQLRTLIERMEAHLAAWIPQPAPALSVVGVPHEAE